jgi:hypothetical protein
VRWRADAIEALERLEQVVPTLPLGREAGGFCFSARQ